MLVRVNGTELFCLRTGEGLPLLAMHGGLGFDHTYFRPWLDPLAERAEIIYYDHRGNGRSGRPTSWEGITHGTWADDAEALRRHLGLERMVLFGHSYGGFLALEYALRYPERLAGLILCNTAPAFDFPEAILANAKSRGTPEQYAALVQGLSAPVPDDAALARFARTIAPLYFHNSGPELPHQVFAQIRFSAAALNHAFGVCAPRFNVVGRLRDIATPTLVIGGRDDFIMPPAFGAVRLAAGLPDRELVVFERSGHFPFAEEAERFLEVVGTWLAQVEARV